MSVAMKHDAPARCSECGSPYESETEKIRRHYWVAKAVQRALTEILRVREGMRLDPMVIADRAANGAMHLVEMFDIREKERATVEQDSSSDEVLK